MFFPIVVVILPVLCLASVTEPRVSLHDGTSVIGLRVGLANQEAFRGIPYAEPPVGNLRLRLAQPKRKLESPYHAREFGHACIQTFYPVPEVPVSEDCLALNIQRPAGTNHSSALPVMVWIHGGAFSSGRSSSPEFNATNLLSHSVSRGTPIIYVNLNYRLGALGFPQGIEATTKGLANLGMKDQMVAFEWIRDNIAAFGGDPKKVTFFGESAGAIALAAHLINPEFRKFASSVILHSGALSVLGGRPELRNRNWDGFVEAAGCANSSVNSWACIRRLTSEDLFNASQLAASRSLSFPPSTDGPGGVIPDRPSKLLAQLGSIDIPILTGVNLDEGTGIAPQSVNSTQTIKDALLRQFANSMASPEELDALADRLLELYPDIPSLGSPYGTGNETFGFSTQFKRMASLMGDLILVAPVRQFNRIFSQAGAPIYTYLFTQHQEVTPPHRGVYHSANIPFVYGQPFEPASVSTKRLSVQMMDYWISFANSQSPNDGLGSPREEWLPYTIDHKFAMHLNGEHPKMIPDNYRLQQIDFIIDNYPLMGR